MSHTYCYISRNCSPYMHILFSFSFLLWLFCPFPDHGPHMYTYMTLFLLLNKTGCLPLQDLSLTICGHEFQQFQTIQQQEITCYHYTRVQHTEWMWSMQSRTEQLEQHADNWVPNIEHLWIHSCKITIKICQKTNKPGHLQPENDKQFLKHYTGLIETHHMH